MTRWERILFWLAVVNFVIFVVIAVSLGGDALNGTARDGHYYLGQHGKWTEVSKPVFIYSAIHTQSLFVTQPLGIFAVLKARFRARD